MSNTKKSKRSSSKRTTKRTSAVRPSLKGKWNRVGAPPKKTKWPNKPFTMDKLFKVNSKGPDAQCELSLRNKVSEGIINPPKGPSNPSGFLYMLADKKQAGGKVGRPKSKFVLKAKFDALKMTLHGSKIDAVVSVPVTPAIPATPPPVEPVSTALPQNFRGPPTLAEPAADSNGS